MIIVPGSMRQSVSRSEEGDDVIVCVTWTEEHHLLYIQKGYEHIFSAKEIVAAEDVRQYVTDVMIHAYRDERRAGRL